VSRKSLNTEIAEVTQRATEKTELK